MSKQETFDTIWEVPDDLWEEIKPLIKEFDPPKPTGRKRPDPRQMLNAMIFRMRTGCHWNKLPAYLGDDSTIHRAFQRWVRLGVFAQVWAIIEEGQEQAGGAGPEMDLKKLIKGSNPRKALVDQGQSRRVG